MLTVLHVLGCIGGLLFLGVCVVFGIMSYTSAKAEMAREEQEEGMGV
jgi:hypothetical protein